LEKIILRVRPEKSARLYAKIWEEAGSPLLINMRSIVAKLEQRIPDAHIAIGMRYGSPAIEDGLKKLKNQGVTHLVIFPLFPQFSSTTSQTAIKYTAKHIRTDYDFQKITTIEDYHDHPAYIRSLTECIQDTWAVTAKPKITLFSFHGVPKRYITRKGEPYQDQCVTTTNLISKHLTLKSSEMAVSYQSRFGPEPWLTPSTKESLTAFGAQRCESLHVVCPGFAVDCLETLEEIAIQGKKTYLQAGGGEFHYIPALNDTELHVNALAEIILDAVSGTEK
jgi:ferrochelatase